MARYGVFTKPKKSKIRPFKKVKSFSSKYKAKEWAESLKGKSYRIIKRNIH